jgi:hypothetical protein
MKQLIWEAYSREHTGELRETERVKRDPFEFEEAEDEGIELWVSFCFKSLKMIVPILIKLWFSFVLQMQRKWWKIPFTYYFMWRILLNFAIFSDRQNFGRRKSVRYKYKYILQGNQYHILWLNFNLVSSLRSWQELSVSAILEWIFVENW